MNYEPTLVFPFALYFAEAKDHKIFALPYKQFLMIKGMTDFEMINLSKHKYHLQSLLSQLRG
jgi:hypothetical protein